METSTEASALIFLSTAGIEDCANSAFFRIESSPRQSAVSL